MGLGLGLGLGLWLGVGLGLARFDMGGMQVVELSGLARVWPEAKRVHPLRGAQAVEDV